jgi:hypothetical protein
MRSGVTVPPDPEPVEYVVERVRVAPATPPAEVEQL